MMRFIIEFTFVTPLLSIVSEEYTHLDANTQLNLGPRTVVRREHLSTKTKVTTLPALPEQGLQNDVISRSAVSLLQAARPAVASLSKHTSHAGSTNDTLLDDDLASLGDFAEDGKPLQPRWKSEADGNDYGALAEGAMWLHSNDTTTKETTTTTTTMALGTFREVGSGECEVRSKNNGKPLRIKLVHEQRECLGVKTSDGCSTCNKYCSEDPACCGYVLEDDPSRKDQDWSGIGCKLIKGGDPNTDSSKIDCGIKYGNKRPKNFCYKKLTQAPTTTTTTGNSTTTTEMKVDMPKQEDGSSDNSLIIMAGVVVVLFGVGMLIKRGKEFIERKRAEKAAQAAAQARAIQAQQAAMLAAQAPPPVQEAPPAPVEEPVPAEVAPAEPAPAPAEPAPAEEEKKEKKKKKKEKEEEEHI